MKEASYTKKGIINDCIQNALCTNNHNAIAEVFVRKKLWTRTVFAKKLADTIEKNMKKQGLICNGTEDMTAYIYSFSIVSSDIWGNCIDKRETMDRGYQYQTVKKWISGDIIPSREVVVQLCLCMVLTLEESNNLLRAAGYSALYYMDVLDIVTIYYLKKYNRFHKLSAEQFEEVKNGHNMVAGWMSGANIYGKKQYKATKEQIPVIQAMEKNKKGKKEYYIDSDADIYYEIKNGEKIIAHPLKKIKLAYSHRLVVCADKNKTHFLEEKKWSGTKENIEMTAYMTDAVKEYMESDEKFFDFVKENVTYLGKIHYGLFQQMQEYIEMSNKYEKNIYNYIGDFSIEDEGNVLKKSGELIFDAKKLLENKGITAKKNIITTLLSMEYKDIKSDYGIDMRRTGSFSYIATFFDGRREKNPIDESVKYLYQHPVKINLIRMLIAMGQEDMIGKILIKAGYWEKDWIAEENMEECEYLDMSDWFIIYMIRFRNALLAAWAKQDAKDERQFINDKRKSFPFHRMALEISEKVKERMKKQISVYETERIEKYLPIHNAKKDRGYEE